MTAAERIVAALEVAASYGGIAGDHHKMWVIDQMVRALTGCPIVGDSYGESPLYVRFVLLYNDGEDGPETYAWEEGIAP